MKRHCNFFRIFNQSLTRRLAGLLLILNQVACTTVAGAELPPLALTEVAPGIHVHQGQHVSIEDPGHGDSANIGFIVGEHCVAVVDSGGSLATGTALRSAIRTRTDKPVCHVINTHGHFDHVLGNAVFAGIPGISFVGHAALPANLSASTELFLRQFGADLGPDPSPEKIILPTQLVTSHLEIDLGGRVIEIVAYPAAHTDADVTVFDRNTGTLWTGDLLFMERIPALDGSLSGWIDVLAELTALPAQRVVPGHGPASAPWPQAAQAEAGYLATLRDNVRAGIADGKFMEDLMESAAAAEMVKWLLHEFHHGRNVARAYTELEWE